MERRFAFCLVISLGCSSGDGASAQLASPLADSEATCGSAAGGTPIPQAFTLIECANAEAQIHPSTNFTALKLFFTLSPFVDTSGGGIAWQLRQATDLPGVFDEVASGDVSDH